MIWSRRRERLHCCRCGREDRWRWLRSRPPGLGALDPSQCEPLSVPAQWAVMLIETHWKDIHYTRNTQRQSSLRTRTTQLGICIRCVSGDLLLSRPCVSGVSRVCLGCVTGVLPLCDHGKTRCGNLCWIGPVSYLTVLDLPKPRT